MSCKFNKANANDVVDRMLPSLRRCVTTEHRTQFSPDYWQFSLHFPLDFSPLNAFFIWETFLIVHFLVEIIIIKVRDRFVLLFFFFHPLTIHFCFLACLLCFTFLSILHNTGIKMVIGVGKCFTSAFIWCWHGIRSRFVIFNECNLC